MKMSHCTAWTLWTLATLFNVVPLAAQELRDPTVAPGEAGTTGGRSATGVESLTVLVRDGRPFLVVGTRLYAPGERFGAMRVERISETEVVLHDGTGLVRIPRFAGIERKTVVEKSSCSVAKPASATKPARVASAAKPAQRPNRAASQARVRTTKPPVAVAPCEDTPS